MQHYYGKTMTEEAVPDFSSRQGAAVVTGGSGGMGSAVCLLLAERGSDIAFSYYNDEAAAREVATSVERSGARVTFAQVDVTDPGDVKAFVDAAAETHGGIHTSSFCCWSLCPDAIRQPNRS